MDSSRTASGVFFLASISGYFHNSSGNDRLQSVSVKDRSSAIAGAIPSSCSLTSASFRTVASHDEIMKIAYKIRNDLQHIPNTILSLKKSKYNADVYMHCCFKCGSADNLHTHHIAQQKDADNETGLINNKFHKNKKFNLMILCEKCHTLLHH